MGVWIEIRDRLRAAFVTHTIKVVCEVCPHCLTQRKEVVVYE